MGALDAGLDTLFQSELAFDGYYTPSGGPAVPVRLMRQAPDVDTDLLGHGSKIQQKTLIFELRASEVAQPVNGATITIGTAVTRITNVTMKDPRRAVWSLEASAT